MWKRLQEKWDLSPIRLLLVLCVFAIGGSLSGYLAKIVMEPLGISSDWLRFPVYFVVVTLLWPLCVLAVSVPFGQLRFFRQYLQKLWLKMTRNKAASSS